MKVLDINQSCCWSFHGRDKRTINLLREAVAIEDPRLRDRALQSIPNGKAFGFIGDVTRLDFAARFFDEVNLNFTPEFSQRGPLHQCVRRWSKTPGASEFNTEKLESRWSSWLNKIFRQLSPTTATT